MLILKLPRKKVTLSKLKYLKQKSMKFILNSFLPQEGENDIILLYNCFTSTMETK